VCLDNPTLPKITAVATDKPACARLSAVAPAGLLAASYTTSRDMTRGSCEAAGFAGSGAPSGAAPKTKDEVLLLSRTKYSFHYPKMFRLMTEHDWPVDCPACTGRAFFTGDSYEQQVLDSNPGEAGWEEEVEKTYRAEEFCCPTRDLYLDSRSEIEAVGLSPDYTTTETRERGYKPEYGNC
jgi:hypothetical protein